MGAVGRRRIAVAAALGALVVFLFVALRTVRSSRDEGAADGRTPTSEGNAPGTERRRAAAAPEPAPRAAEDGERDGRFGPVVDLDSVDRDRDLHGVVVREDGSPVAGADLIVVSHPWRAVFVTTGDARREEEIRGRTRSAVDGAFSLHLTAGARVTLRASAAGLAPLELPYLQAGERVRIVLGEPVALVARVLDVQGKPVPGAAVILGRSGWTGGPALRREAAADDGGSARFDGLPPGLSVFLSTTHPVHGYASREVTLAVSGESTESLAFPAGSETIRGRVYDAETGAGIAGARVGLGWTQVAAVATDADGRYELGGWTGQGYRDLCASAEGFAPSRAEPGSHRRIDFPLRRGRSATGRVVDGTGRAVAGARVSLEADASRGIDVTDVDGGFRIDDLSGEEPHALIVVAHGHGRLRRELPPFGAADADLGDVRLGVSRSIGGRLLDAEGRPLPRSPVVLAGPLPLGECRYGDEDEIHTDDLGRFQFVDVAPGTYELRVWLDAHPEIVRRVQLGPERDEQVELRFAEVPRTVFRVRDEEGAPVAGALVHLEGGYGEMVDAFTDAEGRAEAGFAWPRANAYVWADGFLDGECDFAPDGSEVHLTLLRAGTVTGTALGPDGRPIADARIQCWRGDDVLEGGTTDAEGRFEIRVPLEGTCSIVFYGLDGERIPSGDVARSVEVEGRLDGVTAGSTDLVLRCRSVPRTRRLDVTVLTPEGAGAPSVTVEVRAPQGERLASSATDAAGRCRFEGLPEVALEAWLADTAEWRGDVRQAPRGEDAVTLRFRSALPLRGVVVQRDGTPVSGAYVSAYARQTFLEGAPTDAAGRFSMWIPADTVPPVRLVFSNGTSGLGWEGALDGVAPGDVDVRFVVGD